MVTPFFMAKLMVRLSGPVVVGGFVSALSYPDLLSTRQGDLALQIATGSGPTAAAARGPRSNVANGGIGLHRQHVGKTRDRTAGGIGAPGG